MVDPLKADQLHILVIDDDVEVCALIAQILLPDGHQVVTVNSAEQGLEQLPWFSFQIAFIDQNLPGIDGLVFGGYLRKNNPNMQIALVTGEPTPKVVRDAEEQGIIVIAKPFDISQILDVVSAYRRDAEARLEAAQSTDGADWDPDLASYLGGLPAYFDVPHVPTRVSDVLVTRLKIAFNHIGSIHRYNERERVAVLSGLLAAQVLGLQLPRLASGRTMFEEYDLIMTTHGRRPEFAQRGAEEGPAPE